MRIVIHAGSHHWGNVGDVAMLQAAVERLRTLWPDASLANITHSPESLARYCPGVKPITFAAHAWFFDDRFFGRADPLLPRSVRARVTRIEQGLRRSSPLLLARLIAGKRALALRRDHAAPIEYVHAVRRADLVLVSGGGIFTDAFAENALAVLNTLQFALDQHRPTALMGQGVGPVSDPALKERMAAVLPRVGLIAVRERLESVRLLQALGVSSERITVTGDDALEMANRETTRDLGHAIGVNVRMARYSGVKPEILHRIRTSLHAAAARCAATLVPIPIAQHPDAHDGVAIRELLAGSPAAPADLWGEKTPAEIIRSVSQCRVVLTGSYHAAVFALAQGIPAVAMAASPYYENKFGGLSDLFPGGCAVVRLSGPDVSGSLEAALVSSWDNAPLVRPALLQSAAAQVDLSQKAYESLRSLVLR